jgi:hypothetical protein
MEVIGDFDKTYFSRIATMKKRNPFWSVPQGEL